MPLRLNTRSADFSVSFEALLAIKREVAEDVDQIVQSVIAEVIARGDDALVSYSAKIRQCRPHESRVARQPVGH